MPHASNINDDYLSKILNEMAQKHGCHTVILYGSRSTGDFDTGSDYDIIAIRETGEIEKDSRLFEGVYLDAFIYPEGPINEPDSFLIRIKNGIVLKQKDHQGDELLKHVNDIYIKGPQKTPQWEKKEILAWFPKMLDRAKRADIEGNYRKHWLLTESLNAYFRLHDLWYLGSKKAFLWLKFNDPKVYQAFDAAMRLDAGCSTIELLLSQIIRGAESSI